MRPSQRQPNTLRSIEFNRHYTCHAEGAVRVCYGNTIVLCTASVENSVPRFLREKNQGWVTAEYSMLPRATTIRVEREAKRGNQSARTVEIQRLISRSLRRTVDLQALGPRTIIIDCDVLQADGGTRTAAISGGCVALVDALQTLVDQGELKQLPLQRLVAAVAVGIYRGIPVLDLDYAEDVCADTDMNVVMDEHGGLIEVQGTAEQTPFSQTALNDMLTLAQHGIREIIEKQRIALGTNA